jgi:hypothetical protein
VCLDQRKMALFQNYLLEYLQILAEYLDIEIYISLKIKCMYYEFDDISNTLVKSDTFYLTVFGFKCGLVDQIIKLINHL